MHAYFEKKSTWKETNNNRNQLSRNKILLVKSHKIRYDLEKKLSLTILIYKAAI